MAFRAANTTGTTPAALTRVLTKPTVVDNDILTAGIFVAGSSSTDTCTPPTGWTAFAGQPTNGFRNTTTGQAFFGYTKPIPSAAAETATTYTFTHSIARVTGAIIASYSSNDLTTLLDVNAVSSVNASALTGVTPTITPVTAGCTLLTWISDDTGTSPNITPPTGTNERAEATAEDCALNDEVIAGTSATGTRTFTWTNATAKGSLGISVLLRPAAGAAAPPYHPRLNTLLRM